MSKYILLFQKDPLPVVQCPNFSGEVPPLDHSKSWHWYGGRFVWQPNGWCWMGQVPKCKQFWYRLIFEGKSQDGENCVFFQWFEGHDYWNIECSQAISWRLGLRFFFEVMRRWTVAGRPKGWKKISLPYENKIVPLGQGMFSNLAWQSVIDSDVWSCVGCLSLMYGKERPHSSSNTSKAGAPGVGEFYVK